MQTSPPMQYCFAPKIYLHPFARENSKMNRTKKTIETKANVLQPLCHHLPKFSECYTKIEDKI